MSASLTEIAMTPAQHRTVAVYGIGNFGFALLHYLAARPGGPALRLRGYDQNPGVRAALQQTGRHPWAHPGKSLPPAVEIMDTPEALAEGADILLLAVTSDALRLVLAAVAPRLSDHLIVLNTAKALDAGTGHRLSRIAADYLPAPGRYAALAGGMIADTLVTPGGGTLGADIACVDDDAADTLRRMFDSPQLRIDTTADLAGVEYAAAFKNVVAILAGIAHGTGCTLGAETHLISRAAGEAATLARSLGARAETFATDRQCWGNDLWMSCLGPTRNRRLGIAIGEGADPAQAIRDMKGAHLALEGVFTVRALAHLDQIERFPLLDYTRRLFDGRATPDELADVISALPANSRRLS
jgi:glycerol-3-phosphate dehydrogenase (NAD(P)+)